MTIRIGSGYDVHSFVDGRALVLGGITIPHTRGLAGHSDADTVMHAIVDALLGAAALGDIGSHFPNDVRWKDKPSSVFLEYTRDLLRQHGWGIVNVDATIIAEQPRMSPHTPHMRERLAEILQLDSTQVSVKATSTDKLGFTGRSEGIACQAVALIESIAQSNS